MVPPPPSFSSPSLPPPFFFFLLPPPVTAQCVTDWGPCKLCNPVLSHLFPTLLRTAFSFDCLGGLFHSVNPWVRDLVSKSTNRFYGKRHTGAHDCFWSCWIVGWAHHTLFGTGAGRNVKNTRKETACSFSTSSLHFRAIFKFINFLPCHSAIMLGKGKAKTCCKMIPPLLCSIFYLPARFLIVSAKTSYRPRNRYSKYVSFLNIGNYS